MVAENYTSTFGGENVSPANLSYVAYTISAPITLTWAFEAVEAANVTADKIDINCSLLNATVKLPPANQVTVGQDMLFGNVGAQPYVVTDNSGNTVCTITSGLEWFIFLTNNDTVNGVWRAVQFGASTSVANAATLDGAGLRANVTHLDQDLHTTALVSSYTITDADRANVLQNGGGSVVYTFPDAGVVGNGWFVYIINAGSGNVDLTPIAGQTIDGVATKRIAPGESLAVLSNGTSYHSLGYGRLVSNTITGTSIAVGGAVGTVVLSSTQASAQIQDFTGVLTGNRRIEYGSGIGYWFVYNNTTPLTPYTMTMATTGADTGVIVPQGAFSILRSNGTAMSVAFSGAVGTVTSVSTTANLIGGPITSTGTLDLSSTGVTTGTYGALGPPTTMPSVVVDVKGRITTASRLTLGTSVTKDISTAVGLLDAGKLAVLDSGGNIPSVNGGFQPGDVVYSIALSKPGFVFANSTTIGNAGSGGTQRANADCVNLFAVCWALSPTVCPVFTSTGTSATRGASAAADFAALKRMQLPDLRGTVIAGLDNAGGIANANRISSYVSSTTVGGFGGVQGATVTVPVSNIGVSGAPAGWGGNWWAQGGGIGGYVQGSLRMDGISSIDGVSDAYLRNINTSGGNFAAQEHRHYAFVYGPPPGDGTGYNILNIVEAYMTGKTYVNADGTSQRVTSDSGNNVQPTMVMNPFMKL